MKYILLILALLFATPVFAQQTAQRTYSEELNAEIAQMNDAQKAEALKAIRAGQSDTAAKAREWIDIGNGLGAGLAATAEKLGVVANDFAKSPVGKLAMVLIIWNYMGDDLMGLIIGFPMLFLGGLMFVYQMRKTYGIYNEKGKFIQYDVVALNDSRCGPGVFMSIVFVIYTIVSIVVIC